MVGARTSNVGDAAAQPPRPGSGMGEPAGTGKSRRWLRVLVGCGCGGLTLLAVAVVGLIVMIRLPSAQADWEDYTRDSAEQDAVGHLRAYVVAQTKFHSEDRNGDGKLAHAASCAELGAEQDRAGRPLGLVDKFFLAAHGPGGQPLNGYLFLEMKTIDGREIDWSNDFALRAFPAPERAAAWPSFIVRTDGVVWRKWQPEPGEVDDFPADPAAQGWTKAQ